MLLSFIDYIVNMQFQKGRSKTGGRKAGTPNKKTQFAADTIMSLLTEYADSGQMSRDFAELEPRERITIAERMMPYIIPKRSSVDASVATTTDKTIEDTLKDLASEN